MIFSDHFKNILKHSTHLFLGPKEKDVFGMVIFKPFSHMKRQSYMFGFEEMCVKHPVFFPLLPPCSGPFNPPCPTQVIALKKPGIRLEGGAACR